MDWQEVTERPELRNLPFKIELNQDGEITMNPVKIKHSFFQNEIGHLMRTMRNDGFALTECAIKTSRGTKCADIAWASLDVFLSIFVQTEADIAPEVCVEVLSMSNSDFEIREKRGLYFERGANEVWTCDEYGTMRFFDSNGKIERSKMFPEFPLKIEIPTR
jgi:Uma2 family endonuclease